MKPPRYDFTPDNPAGTCPEAAGAAFVAANAGRRPSYASDHGTARAAELMGSAFAAADFRAAATSG